jgi:glutamate--cysteine ligase
MMQAISGVHFNYSFPDALWPVLEAVNESKLQGRPFIDDAYFGLLRNYRRYGWLILFLFGVSPAVCRSFFAGRDVPAGLEPAGRGTLIAPHATSLRMSDLGYRNKNQAGVYVSVNSLEEYVRDLSRIISTPHPEYEAQGVEVDGEWRQLNANLLQIENEYYSFIRPKRVAFSGERPTKALLRAGVQYVEMRSLDIGAYDPVGVNQRKLLFLEAFAALCLLRESPPLSHELSDKYEANHVLVAGRGREPGLRLWTEQGALTLTDWAAEILDQMQGLCELLDAGERSKPYSAALAFQRAKLADFGELPSARLLEEMRRQERSFFEVGLWISAMHRDYFRELYPPNPARLAELREEAAHSLDEQRTVEARDAMPFAEFVARYTAGSLV